jgi:cation:H+ antiporter
MKSIIIICIGFFLLIKGAEILVDGATGIARKFNISEIIIGVTIVSIGTSLPELMISVQSAIRGVDDISLGNVLGSCICNILLILGISSLFHSIEIDLESKKTILPLNIIAIILVFLFGNMDMSISRVEGLMLLGIFVIFILYIINCSKQNSRKSQKADVQNQSDEEFRKNKNENILKSIVYIILGMIRLKIWRRFCCRFSN